MKPCRKLWKSAYRPDASRYSILAVAAEFEKQKAALPPFCAQMIRDVRNGKVTGGMEMEFYARVITAHLAGLKTPPKSETQKPK